MTVSGSMQKSFAHAYACIEMIMFHVQVILHFQEVKALLNAVSFA